MTAPSAGRSVEQIEEPFKNGLFAGLSLDHVSVVQVPDPYWEAYSQTGDAQQLGRSWAAMLRAANGPNFFAALAPDRNSEPLLDDVSARLAALIASEPTRIRTYNLNVVVGKAGPSALFRLLHKQG